jgi:hypothetical protein
MAALLRQQLASDGLAWTVANRPHYARLDQGFRTPTHPN